MKKNYIRKQYEKVTSVLSKKYELSVPPLKISHAKRYYGQLQKRITRTINGKEISVKYTIFLSEHLFWSETFLKYEPKPYVAGMDIEDRISLGAELRLALTICHEIAHLTEWKHGSQHKALTEKLFNYYCSTL
jgi:hypothetical protein